MNDPITLESGAILTIQIAPFSLGWKLSQVIARELAQVRLELDASVDLKKLGGNDVNTLKNVAFQLLQSETLERAVFACMEKCLYNGQRITAQTFEPEDARQDYLPVAWEVIKVNLRPFVKNLGSLLSAAGAMNPSEPRKSE